MRQLKAMCALAALDLLMWRRSPLAVASALIPPLGMALLLVVLTFTVGQQPVALVIQSDGLHSQSMAKLIKADDEAYALTVTSMPIAAAMLKSQEVAAVITIPPDFDRAVTARTASLRLTLNNIDVDFADDIRRSVERSVGQFDAPQLGADADESDDEKGGGDKAAHSPNPYHITIEEHNLRVTSVDFLHYQVLPVLILLVLSVGLMGTSLLCARDGERGTARLLVLSPPSAWVLVAGRLLGGMVASMAILIVAIAICAATHTISAPLSHWPALAALFLATALCASGMGAMLGTAMRGQRNVGMASSILATYLFFLGGGFTTIAFLPTWLRDISAVNPIRYAIDGMRQALFYPDLRGLPLDLAVLTGAAAATVLFGSILVVRSWRT